MPRTRRSGSRRSSSPTQKMHRVPPEPSPRTHSIRQGENILSIGRGQLLTSSRSSLPTLKKGIRFSGMETFSPVLGLRPSLDRRRRTVKLPKPRISIFSPRCRASLMFWKTVSTMTSHSFLVRVEIFSDSFCTRSLFVILVSPPEKLLCKVVDPGTRLRQFLVDYTFRLFP